ncbi:unnamed protein product, partial [marine sediment metagenome]
DMPKTRRIRALMRWSWRREIFWSMDFDEYSYGGHMGKVMPMDLPAQKV